MQNTQRITQPNSAGFIPVIEVGFNIRKYSNEIHYIKSLCGKNYMINLIVINASDKTEHKFMIF